MQTCDRLGPQAGIGTMLRLDRVVLGLAVSIAVLATTCPLLSRVGAQPLPGDYPHFEIEAIQEGGQVVFNFYRVHQEGSDPQKMIPVQVSEVRLTTLTAVQERIWHIYSFDWRTAAYSVTLGIAPQGFTQVVPPHGPAARLEKNRTYQVSARGEGRNATITFTYSGR